MTFLPFDIDPLVLSILFAIATLLCILRFFIEPNWMRLGKALPKLYFTVVYLSFEYTGFVASHTFQASLVRDGLFLWLAIDVLYDVITIVPLYLVSRRRKAL